MPPNNSIKFHRYGLITWAILKILVALPAFDYVMRNMYCMILDYGVLYNVRMLVILLLLGIALVVDICMSVLLIVGEKKKSYKIVSTYFHYAVYAVIAAITIITLFTTYELAVLYGVPDYAPWRELRTFRLSDVVKLATIGTIYVLVEVFIVLVLRKETVSMKKLEIQKLNSKDFPSEADSFVEA